ncbi:Hypothetical predicted protein [Pelobates cultripes]|uniref:Uncharacterized protein n=1 Tax=Pelobates cultripes TaxID=61616 RepID=A0AAD1THK9_PELCU|nr:Hypothetical predicted protein [Pelobates cultripes]
MKTLKRHHVVYRVAAASRRRTMSCMRYYCVKTLSVTMSVYALPRCVKNASVTMSVYAFCCVKDT